MITLLAEIVKNFKEIAKNLRAVTLVSILGILVGFAGYPLWVLYRNEQEIVGYLLAVRNPPAQETLTREQIVLIRSKLVNLYHQPGVNRVIFGTVSRANRLIHLESYSPVGDPLPTGYQSIYLHTPDYNEVYSSLLTGNCVLVEPPPESHMGVELELSQSVKYLTCPSGDDWFLGVYLDEFTPEILTKLRDTVRDLEGSLEPLE